VSHVTAVRLVLLVAMAGPGPAWAQQPPVPPEPTVVTTGEGIVQTAPDRAWITIAAESRATSPREAQRRNAEAMRPVQEALRAAKVPPDAIRTQGYDLQQEWDFVKDRRVSRGYVARNAIEVRVDDTSRVGELLELAVGSGATSVSGLRFDLKDRAKLEREALRLAVASARGKAEAAAAGAGRTLDRVIRIDEQGVSMPVPMPMMRTMAQDAVSSDAPPIAAGQVEIRATVTVTSALK
jgi:uncharacterized protein YggE